MWQRSLAAVLAMLVVAAGVGLAFAGSPRRLADGVTIAGVDVGGLEPGVAQQLLERRADALARVPVVFTAAGRRWRLRPTELGVEVDWRAAVAAARRQGAGVGPLRGLRRIGVRVFGADVAPPTHVWEAALEHELRRIAREVDVRPREASIVLKGLRPVVVAERGGQRLDRGRSATVIVRALASLQRTAPAALPVRPARPRVTAADLAPAARRVRTAVSAPVRLSLGPTKWRLPRWRLAELLELPKDGARDVRIGGARADSFFGRLQRRVNRKPVDAAFAISGTSVRVLPSKVGRRLDVGASAAAILRAAASPSARVARLTVATEAPERTTAEAEAMGVTGLVASYETIYGGDANRIHNVRLVARLVDGHLIRPGETFSFNETTGERTAEKGFLEAPVIINGELQTGLGGGVCQVSTTVFNAAYEAGLPIAERTNHALYISHYPQGRDATVNYPDLDLKFVNDTGHWLLLRTFVGASSLVVGLYGTPTGRRVVTETAPLVEGKPPRVERVEDPELEIGRTVLEDAGEPSRSTSVRRRVYDRRGRLLSEATWRSYYLSEARIVRVGTKPRPEPATTSTATTSTTTATRPATTTTATTTRPLP